MTYVLTAPRLPLDNQTWIPVRDGDLAAWLLFQRHYSKYHYKDGRLPRKIVGPGYYILLINAPGTALFCWRKFRNPVDSGICCNIFRNESPMLSSLMILEAEQIAWTRWPEERLYTYVNPRAIRSTNPGFCFISAGWHKCRVTKKNQLLVFEKFPTSNPVHPQKA
jgi:hypothetical protein